MSLKYRIALAILAFQTLLVAVVFSVFLRHTYAQIEAEYKQHNAMILSRLQEESLDALLTSEYRPVQSAFHRWESSYVLGIHLTDFRGNVVASTVTAALGQPLPVLEDDEAAYWNMRPVHDAFENLGQIHVRFSKIPMAEMYRRGMLWGASVAVMLILLTAALGMAAGQYFAKRIRVLAAVSGQLAMGRFDVVVDTHGRDELSELARSLGDMARQLAETFRTMQTRDMKMRESEKKLGDIAASLGEGVLVLDRDAMVTFVNPSACRLLGWNESDLVGAPLRDRVHCWKLDGTLCSSSECPLLQPLETGHGQSMEIVLDRQDGSTFAAYVINTPIWEDGACVGAVTSFVDITERRESEERVQAALQEKVVLLRELHHRTKNNMAVIIGLLNLTASSRPGPEVESVFAQTKARIQAMALVHEKLYQSADLSNVDLGEYARDLSRNLFMGRGIRFELEADPISISIDKAVPFGLVLNELLTNCAKHAFPGGKPGIVRMSLRRGSEGRVDVRVSDNGVGFSMSDGRSRSSSLGLHLVTQIVENQLGGRIEWPRAGGSDIFISFAVLSA